GAEPREAREGREGQPRPAEARGEDDDGARRRRRGRRGGRRMRDDRPADPYAWVRPWGAYGGGPFVWDPPAEGCRRPRPASGAGPVGGRRGRRAGARRQRAQGGGRRGGLG